MDGEELCGKPIPLHHLLKIIKCAAKQLFIRRTKYHNMHVQNTDKSIAEYASEETAAVLKDIGSSDKGLPQHEAKRRLHEFGRNIIAEKEESSLILQFLSHFTNPMILILLFAAGISALIGERTNAAIIGIIVLFGVLLDFYQEYSADKALKRLIDSVKTTATALRDGRREEIRASELVAGDVILLSSGDMVPADARIIEAKDFFVNQSAMTGESLPCEKTEARISNAGHSINAMDNIVFSGTNVISGSATAAIIKTGKDTEFGKISAKLAQAPIRSEFENGIDNFGMFILKLTFFLVTFIFLFNSLAKRDYFESFMFAIAIAVGLTPELLPMIMSTTMIAGSKKMEKKGVIVKKLSAIPNFGSMDILCTDKTGTLTENRIELVKYTDYAGKHDKRVLLLAYLNSSFQTGIRNPLDEAVLDFRDVDIKKYKKIDEVPYDFFRKRMSIVANKAKGCVLITKGAPEEIFKLCDHCAVGPRRAPFDEKTRNRAMQVYRELSSEGYRVLAVAEKKVKRKSVYSKEDEADMDLAGFVSFLDPPKRDVKSVIKELQELGVEIKVITGDNELVTKKICDEVGLEIKGILLGEEIGRLADNALRARARNATIFAKFSPADKSRLITALRSGGDVVGYLGDGVNDAPALRAADVSISVNTAVDAAKESADFVLTKKSLHDLKEGIIDGRKTFGNTMKYVMMSLSSNFGNMFSATGAILFLPFLPMLPVQILLNNLIYDISQTAIPTDEVDKEWVQKPKRWDMKFVREFMYVFGPLSSLFDFITFFVLFYVLKASAPMFQTGWFIESLATQTLVIHIIRTKNTPFVDSTPSRLLLFGSIICLAFGITVPYTSLGAVFGFTPLPMGILGILAAIVAAYLFAVEIVKKWFYRRYDF